MQPDRGRGAQYKQHVELVGVVVRRRRILAAETSIRRGLRATSAVRTIADLACRLPLTEAVALLDMALHGRLVNSGRLRDWASTPHRLPRHTAPETRPRAGRSSRRERDGDATTTPA